MSGRIAGTVFFRCGTLQFKARGAFKYSAATLKRKMIPNWISGAADYSEQPLCPFIEGEITDLGGATAESLMALTNASFTLELANGKVFGLSGASVVSLSEVDTVEGKLTIRVEGKHGNESTAA